MISPIKNITVRNANAQVKVNNKKKISQNNNQLNSQYFSRPDISFKGYTYFEQKTPFEYGLSLRRS